MARTIRQIKSAMTQQFMNDSVIIERYGFAAGSTFEDTFSAVSLESIWFSIVASAIYVLETLFDAFKEDVDAKIATAVLHCVPSRTERHQQRVCLQASIQQDLVGF